MKVSKMAIFGHFSKKWGKTPDSGDPGRGVLHQPLAPGPRGSRGGVWTPARAGRLPGASRRPFSGPPGTPGTGTAPGNRGAPARGVDVKPPSADGSGRGPRPSGTRDGVSGLSCPGGGGSRIPDPVDPGPRGPGSLPGRPGGAGRPPRALGAPSPEGFYINPSRRGPAVPQGVPPGTG